MKCGAASLEDCVTAHIAPALDRHCKQQGRQWHKGKCPVCGARSLSLAIKDGRSLLWTCHRLPTGAHPEDACEYAAILSGAATVPSLRQCIGGPRKAKPGSVSLEDLAPLLELGDAALRLRLACIVWQVPPKDAASRLGMSRRTYYRAVSGVPDLARKPRSA